MFNKLLSNLQFNPSLIQQVSFYAKRLHRETSVRRLGVIFVVLAMLVQIFAIISPPQPTLARSGNDLIDGGIGSRDDAVFHCRNNTGDYSQIMAHFDISCENIAVAQTVTLNSRDYGGNLFSMGRIAYGKAGETPVGINGSTYWLRYLWSWDGASSSSYTALRGTSRTGKTFFILFNCGNLVFIGLPPPPTPICFWNPALLLTDAACQTPKCPFDTSLLISDGRCKACPYDQSITRSNARCVPCPNPNYPNVTKDSPRCQPVCPYNNSIDKNAPACKPCEASQTRQDKTSCLELSKKASNDTQGLGDANNTTARPGDVITYTLSVKNNGKANIDNFIVQENISDVLDYADVVTLNGSTKDSNNIISWPKLTIKAGETIQRQFSVKVKDPIPATPISSSDPGHFDLNMTNVYGNAVNIKVPGNIIKTTEIITRTLPNTGSGSSLIIGFSLFTIVGYFFARSRLLAKELDIVRTEYTISEGI